VPVRGKRPRGDGGCRTDEQRKEGDTANEEWEQQDEQKNEHGGLLLLQPSDRERFPDLQEINRTPDLGLTGEICSSDSRPFHAVRILYIKN
jgi:hypothetical protein